MSLLLLLVDHNSEKFLRLQLSEFGTDGHFHKKSMKVFLRRLDNSLSRGRSILTPWLHKKYG